MQNQKLNIIALPQKMFWDLFLFLIKNLPYQKTLIFSILIFGLLHRKYFARKTACYSKNNTIYMFAFISQE